MKFPLVALVSFSLLFGSHPSWGQAPRPCFLSGWTPELYSFYGSKETIHGRLAAIKDRLTDRRLFLQLNQGKEGGEVDLFERQEDGSLAVTSWKVEKTADLLALIDQMILKNHGEKCVGDAVKKMLAEKIRSKPEESKMTGSIEAALDKSLDKLAGAFSRVCVVVLC